MHETPRRGVGVDEAAEGISKSYPTIAEAWFAGLCCESPETQPNTNEKREDSFVNQESEDIRTDPSQ